MSSSKIIKLSDSDNSGVFEFNFRTIGQAGLDISAGQTPGAFIPLGLFQGFDPQATIGEELIDAGPPPLEISEDELNQRISDAHSGGLTEGKELAERGLINVFRALRAASETIHNLRDKILRDSEDEIIKLVMLVARKVILQEITQDRSILTGVVKNAIAGLSAREEVTVHLNPDDYLLVTSGREESLHRELINDRLSLKPDLSVAAGFCLVETAMGTIDASLDGQLEQIYRSFLEQRSAEIIEAP